MKCPKCHSSTLEELNEERLKCRNCGANFRIAYHCRICGTEISKEQYEEHDEMCECCEDNEEMDEDEDFGIARHY